MVDDQFDLDYHFRTIRIGATGTTSEAELRRAAAQLINDPFDEARPLWQLHLITGLGSGRSAMVGRFHHSISDGIGLLRLAGSLLELEPDAPPPAEIDVPALLREKRAADGDSQAGDDPRSVPGRLKDWMQSAARSIPGPVRVVEAGVEAVASARAVTDTLPKSKASELLATRSRNRRLVFCTVPVDGLRRRAAELDVTINDLFVAACAEGVVRYHRELGADLARITATVVVSTQPSKPEDELGGGGDNAFIPVAIELPGDGASNEDRLAIVHREVRERRSMLTERRDLLGKIGALSELVPSSVVAALAINQAAKVDFATSNIPGPPMATWLAGVPVRRIHPIGPVAGTAFNVTLMTSQAEAVLGIHLDPAAVTEPDLLRRCISRSFGDFGVPRR